MKKVLFLTLLAVSLTACSGGKNTKIKDIGNMKLGQIERVNKSLTPKQARKLTDAIVQCQMNSQADVCDERIKKVVK